jgi:hypothetical protein
MHLGLKVHFWENPHGKLKWRITLGILVLELFTDS